MITIIIVTIFQLKEDAINILNRLRVPVPACLNVLNLREKLNGVVYCRKAIIYSMYIFHPAGDVLCIWLSRESWYRKAAFPKTGAG